MLWCRLWTLHCRTTMQKERGHISSTSLWSTWTRTTSSRSSSSSSRPPVLLIGPKNGDPKLLACALPAPAVCCGVVSIFFVFVCFPPLIPPFFFFFLKGYAWPHMIHSLLIFWIKEKNNGKKEKKRKRKKKGRHKSGNILSPYWLNGSVNLPVDSDWDLLIWMDGWVFGEVFFFFFLRVDGPPPLSLSFSLCTIIYLCMTGNALVFTICFYPWFPSF